VRRYVVAVAVTPQLAGAAIVIITHAAVLGAVAAAWATVATEQVAVPRALADRAVRHDAIADATGSAWTAAARTTRAAAATGAATVAAGATVAATTGVAAAGSSAKQAIVDAAQQRVLSMTRSRTHRNAGGPDR
jgi:hypothetical protein